MTQPMKFEHEKGATRSKYVAGLVVLAVVGWMASGYIRPDDGDAAVTATPAEQASKPIAVVAVDSQAQPVPEIFTAEGQSQSERAGMIVAQTGGTVAAVLVQKGQIVTDGQVLARIDPAQRAADLRRTQADLERAQRELNNAETLLERGVTTQDRVVAARSALAAAEAGLANAQEAMNDLDITAPFGGRLESFDLQVGQQASPGVSLGTIVDMDPLVISFRVPQQSVSHLAAGLPAQVEFITGVSRRGTLTFVGSSADAQTRTFEAEISVPNPGSEVPAGVSAEVYIPTGETRAHFLSPSILSQDTQGALGVKAVDDDNRIAFYPVEIVRAETNGLWVSGLPDALRLVTIGQGFVNEGELVDPRPEEDLTGDTQEASE